jgi:hypothetical protein
MPSLSLNVGLNNGRKLPFGGGAAPSGIPVASTNTITVVDTSNSWTGTYNKTSSTTYENSINPDKLLYFDGGAWSFSNFTDEQFRYAVPSATNPNFIPYTGWPQITLTAA